MNGVSKTTGAPAPQTCEARAAPVTAFPTNLLKGDAERLADELMEARADRDLAEAENRSLAEHHTELRAELLRLQTLVKEAGAGRRSLEADPREATLMAESGEARAGFESELKRRPDMASETARLQADLASTQSRLASAQTEIENLLLRTRSYPQLPDMEATLQAASDFHHPSS